MYTKVSKPLIALVTVLHISFFTPGFANSLNDAVQAIEKKEYSTAVIHLKNQLKETPKNAQARYLLGNVYLRTGKLAPAIKELQRASEYAPENQQFLMLYIKALLANREYEQIIKKLPVAATDNQIESERLSYLGYAYMGLQQIDKAKQSFQKANAIQAGAISYNGMVKIALVENDIKKAAAILAKSLQLEPDNAESIQLKAKLANINKKHQDAIKEYDILVNKQPQNSTYLLERAATYSVLKKDDLAKKDIESVLKRAKSHPQANFLKAQILLREKDFKGAQAAAQQVLNVAPKHLPASFLLGAAHFGLKNYNQAEKHLTIFLSENPNNLKAKNLLANIYLAQNKRRQAELTLSGISPKAPNQDAATLMTLGDTLMRSGNTEEGMKFLNEAQNLAPSNQDIRKRLIAAQFQIGEVDSAISELEQLSNSNQAEDNTNYLLVISYIRKKEFAKAEAKIEALLQKTPKDTKLLNLGALIEQLKGNTEQAVINYKNIIQLDSKDIPAHMGLARLTAAQSNWSEAEQYFRQVLKINPKTIKAHLGLAALADKQNNLSKTEKHFFDAIKQSEDSIETKIAIGDLMGRWYSNNKQPEKLLVLAAKFNRQHPNNSQVKLFLAKAQLLNKQNSQSEKTLKQIIAGNPEDIKHRVILLKLIIQDRQRADEALALADKVISLEPDNIELNALKAALLMKLGEYDQALVLADKIQQKFPDKQVGILIKADILRAKKKYQQALTLYLQAYKKQPDKKILASSVDMLLALNKKDEAKKMLAEALKKDPKDTNNLFKLASLYHEKQQLQEARKYYERILTITPNHVATLNNIAWLYEKDVKKALEYAQKAHQLAPNSAAIKDSYGYFLVQAGEHKKGLPLLEEASTGAPKDNSIRYHLAYAYKLNGQTQKARAILQELANSEQTFPEKNQAKKLLSQVNKMM